MQPQQFNILGARPFGEPYNSRAGMLQRYYLQLEGFDPALESIAWDKKADAGPPQLGPAWAVLEQAQTKAGKPYWKFKKQSAPDGQQTYAPQPQTQLPVGHPQAFGNAPQTAPKPAQAPFAPKSTSGTISHGEALVVASNIITGTEGSPIEDVVSPIEDVVKFVYEVAEMVQSYKPKPVPVAQPAPVTTWSSGAPISQPPDVVLTDIDDGPVDLDDIPF